MATITSVGSGLWSAAGTWDAGVPVDDSVVIIAAGHIVEFDVDQSGFANGIDGITITGTLKLTRTPGTYYLKIKAAKTITGAGTFDCGASALDPIPFAAKHTITGGSGWFIDGAWTLQMTAFGVEPTHPHIRLSSAEAIGQTELSVDTDVTGDLWSDGAQIIIIDAETGKDIEIRTIAAGGIASGTITVTAGLTAAKNSGASVILCDRNLKLSAVGTKIFSRFYNSKLIIGSAQCTISNSTIMFSYASATITGGIFYPIPLTGTIQGEDSNPFLASNAYFIGFSTGAYPVGHSFDNCFIGGMGYISLGTGTMLTNCFLRGNQGITIVGGVIDNCVFSSGGYGLQGSANISNSSFSGHNRDLPSFIGTLYNTELLGNEVNYYDKYSAAVFTASYDHDKVPGAVKFWTNGGISVTQATVVPSGYSQAFKTTFENVLKYGYWQKQITVGAGASVNITMNLRKDASMAYLPRVIIFNRATTDPFAGGAGLYTFTMTDSIDTWESDVYTYTNTTGEDITLVVRCQGMNATGNMYSALNIEQINVDLTNAIALITAVKAKTDNLTFTVTNQVDANALTGGGGASAADVADAVWDEAIAEHVAAGSFGATNQKVVPSESVNDYKADVSSLAREATLTAMKGAGWTTETLKAILTAVEAVSASSGETAEEVWEYAARTLTQSAASVASAVAGSTITATRGDTLSAALTNIGALTNYDKIWFTVKADEADTDAQSLIQIELSDGLKYINGAAAVTAGNGSLTIVDEATGGVTIALHEVEMAKLALGSYHYDIQILRTTGIAVSTLSSGTFIVSADYTKATS